MFRHIEEIQRLVFAKCDAMDDTLGAAEEKFKVELNKAIKEEKKAKKLALGNRLKTNLQKNNKAEIS